jgi:SAM-dependent methyltransferase
MVNGAQNQDFRTLPRLWPAPGGRRALDLGCGAGLYTRELARQGARALGVDLDLARLREARGSAGGQGIGWIRADAAWLPFRPEAFDLVVSVEVLTHLAPEARSRVFGEIHRVVRPGGAVLATLHNRARLSLGRWLRLRRPRPCYPTSHLTVWPTSPAEAGQLAALRGLRPLGRARYLNFHSRFTHRFSRDYPRLSRLVAALEDLLSGLPLARRLGITFLLSLSRAEGQ